MDLLRTHQQALDLPLLLRSDECRYEVVQTARQWNGLQSEWNELLTNSSANCLFLSWEWLDTWLRVRTDPPELFVVCVRTADGQLLGAAPFYKAAFRFLGLAPYRVLRIIGAVDSGAEYQTWIARQGCEYEVFGAMARALHSLRSEWDLMWLPRLDCWSNSQQPMLAALRNGGLWFNRRACLFSAAPLPDAYEAYLACMSANRRQQIRRMSHRILGRPGVEIRKVTARGELAAALQALFELHGKRWRTVGQRGVFASNPNEQAFYEQFVPRAFDAGWLALYMLLDHSEAKAVQLGYIYDSVFLQLQEGFDPEYSPHVGNVLRAHVIQDCIHNGVREYDFLGGVTEHKRRWLARRRVGADVLAGAPSLKNLPILRGGVWPTGAYLTPRSDAGARSAIRGLRGRRSAARHSFVDRESGS